ncbi:Nuclear receptor coactivator 2 [Larimichthys crocea]|uniref:Uncharacterized protein n=1 Tax=Larimichthys crocea TaxID=215358 RepID=A0ACD3QQK3_LARCR|nr:Nuclear receptor coactivator 2 [Larimichthys crocea]
MLINPHVDGEVRPPSDQQDASQQKYETMQCFAVSEPKSIKEEGEDFQSCLICVARRVPVKERPVMPTYESFTTRQDLQGKITSLDTSLLRASMKPGWEDLVRRCIQRFHLQNDGEMSFAKKHQQDVLRNGHALSPLYRFSLADGNIVSAHTKSKLVRSTATNEPQLYMSAAHPAEGEHGWHDHRPEHGQANDTNQCERSLSFPRRQCHQQHAPHHHDLWTWFWGLYRVGQPRLRETATHSSWAALQLKEAPASRRGPRVPCLSPCHRQSPNMAASSSSCSSPHLSQHPPWFFLPCSWPPLAGVHMQQHGKWPRVQLP